MLSPGEFVKINLILNQILYLITQYIHGGYMYKMLAVLLVSGFSTFAMANDAGCGLGSLIIKSNGKLTQLLALTTNGSFFSQIFGITSGTSGCSSKGLVQNDKAIQYFVEVNQEDLTHEIAQGQGEKLNTLASLHGCSTEANVKLFAESAQAHFPALVPRASTTANEFITNLKSTPLPQICAGV